MNTVAELGKIRAEARRETLEEIRQLMATLVVTFGVGERGMIEIARHVALLVKECDR